MQLYDNSQPVVMHSELCSREQEGEMSFSAVSK